MTEEPVEYSTAPETPLAEQVAELRSAFVAFAEAQKLRIEGDNLTLDAIDVLDNRIAALERHNADGDLTAPISGSLALVELRGIRKALETLSSVVYAEDEFKHRREIKVGSWSGAEPAPEPEPPVIVRIEALERQRKFDHEEMIRLADRQTRLEVGQPEPQPCDCDPDCAELWRLAREWLATFDANKTPKQDAADKYSNLVIFVREHTP